MGFYFTTKRPPTNFIEGKNFTNSRTKIFHTSSAELLAASLKRDQGNKLLIELFFYLPLDITFAFGEKTNCPSRERELTFLRLLKNKTKVSMKMQCNFFFGEA